MSFESDFSDISWVVDSKFAPCQPGLELVRRERLLKQLNEGLNKKLVLVTAPAGYGKSSLLGQWAAETKTQNTSLAWLTMENDEADGKRFLAYFTLTLSRIGVDLDELVTGARNGFSDSALETVLSKLIKSINDIKNRTVIILEDYHHAECDQVNEIIRRLLRDVLSDFTIFIDSRVQPNLGVFSLIASGDATEIDAAQLRLTKDETLSALGDITDEQTSLEVYEQTEGWPVAVQLVRIQIKTRPSDPVISGAKGGLFASYATEQILSSLDEETQDFLLTVAFLDRFNSDLINSIMGSSTAWDHIDSLVSFSALIIPLDLERGWYRLHHLFAEYLKELQVRRNSVRAKQIMTVASQWHANNNDMVRAVRYAATANDYELCRQIIRNAGGWRIILTEGIGELRGALRLLPNNEIEICPAVTIAQAYLHCKDGEFRQARAKLNSGIELIDDKPDEVVTKGRLVVESMVNLYEDVTEWSDDYSAVRNDFLSRDLFDPLEKGTLKCEEILISVAKGEIEEAATHLSNAFAYMRQSGSVLGLNYCYIHAAHIALYSADFDIAKANIDRALSMAEENFGSDSGLKYIALVLSFTLRAWRGTVTQEDKEDFEIALSHIFENDGWADLYIVGLEGLSLCYLKLGDRKGAVRSINKFLLLARQKDFKRVHHFIEALLASIDENFDFPTSQSPRDFSKEQKYWQVNAQAVIAALSRNVPIDHQSIVDFTLHKGLSLKYLKLKLAVAAHQTHTSLGEEFFDVVRRASRHGVVGSFLMNPNLMQSLRGLRGKLRHDERELMTLQFVDDILEKAKTSNATKVDDFFSERETEVLQRLAKGQSNKEIARELELTENTVKFHLKSIYAKLSVNKRTQAVVEAQQRGLLD